MTRIQRRLLIDTSVIGVTLTLLIVLLNATTHLLQPLDDWFYDLRARHCQYFTPPATDKLIHVDIDDTSLDAIGKWPWPRDRLAEIIDEIDRAGAKAIFMDIIFDKPGNGDPDNPSVSVPRLVRGPQGRIESIDDDGLFAAAVERSKKCLVPIELKLYESPSPIFQKLFNHLAADLEIKEDQAGALLRKDGVLSAEAPFPADLFVVARAAAMKERVGRAMLEGSASVEDLRRKLLPKTDPDVGGSPLIRLLVEERQRFIALAPLLRFTMAAPRGMPPLARYTGELAPIASLSRAAAYCGMVNYLNSGTGVVRAVPLFGDYRGRLFPQTDLALACAVLGVDVHTLRISADRVVIPKPRGYDKDIVIPVRSMYNAEVNSEVGMFMDVPVRGKAAWETMYDPPRFLKAEKHLSMAGVWQPHLLRERIKTNNHNIDRAISVILDADRPDHPQEPPRIAFDPERWKKYANDPPAPDDTAARKKLVEELFKDLKDFGYIAQEGPAKSLNAVSLLDKGGPPKTDRDRGMREEFARAVKAIDSAFGEIDRIHQLIDESRKSLRGKISGKAVMIGWVSTGHQDVVSTAIQPNCPGVVVHGMVFNAIVTGDFWRHAPKWVTTLITILIGLMVTAANGFLKPSMGLIAAILIGAAYLVINGIVLFDYGNLCVGVAGPMAALGSVWSTGALAGLLIEATERARITKRFSSYVDQKLVDHVIENPDAVLDGQVREMSVIFTDLAGFTSLSEQLRERTVPILSRYLGLMVPIIRANEGFVNKFLGDGIMCFYNAPNDDPDHAVHAVRTVLEMQKAMVGFSRELKELGLPQVSMRCGVSTGQMVVGDSGPADASDYTVLGDVVNFASRLEGANKATGTNTLISQRTSEMIGDKFLLRAVGKLQVVGKSEGVMTYEPLALIDDATLEDRMLCATCAELAAAFVARDFARCIQVADQMDQHFGGGRLPALYRKTAGELLANPPGPDFSGSLVLTEK